MKPEIHTRLVLIEILTAVLEQQQSLTHVLATHLISISDPRDRSLVQFCAYGICRDYFRLDAIVKKLVSRLPSDQRIYYLLLIGIYQLNATRIPSFAIVHSTVDTAKALKLFTTTGLINGVLRHFQRKQQELCTQLDRNPVTYYSHPQWLIKALQSSWPTCWKAICTANNQHPPMWLRINARQMTAEAYIALLEKKNMAISVLHNNACCLTSPTDVTELPGFSEGWVSVQDKAAQMAVQLLDLQPHQRVLDACAAPGGKTGHILEKQPLLTEVIAIDNDPQRVEKIHENLTRLHLTATIIHADASELGHWKQELFDRILLDAPCSATGVIRRHPDIKILRKSQDIIELAKQQLALLKALWPLLKTSGKLVYATCSILPQENDAVIAQFCEKNVGAQVRTVDVEWGMATEYGRQILPGEHNMDGFFYAVLEKTM